MKWLRWQGLVGFFAVIALIALLWWWLADWWIARTIERIGSDTVGAEVNVDQVDLRLQQGQFVLDGLQVTNASQPERNLIEIGQIDARINTEQLLWRRVHIEDMQINGIQFNTMRQSKGWVAEGGPKGIAGLVPEIANFDFAALGDSDSAMALLDSLKLESLQSVHALQNDIKQAREQFEQKREQLPDEAKIESYQQRFKKLKEGSDGKGLERGLALLGKGTELDQLRKEIKADLNNIRALRDQMQQNYKQFKNRYQEIKAAPAKDVDRMLNNFSFDVPGTDRLISGVLGPTLEGQLNDGLQLYQSAEPWINKARVVAGQDPDAPPPPARAEGVNVHYPERDPQPEFWLKKASLNGLLEWAGWQGDFSGQLTDVTDQPQLIGKPIALNLKGTGKPGGAFNLDATIDTIPAAPAIDVNAVVDGIKLGSYTLSHDPQLALTSQSATLNAQLSGSSDDSGAHMNLVMRFRDLALNVQSNNDNDIVQTIISEIGRTDALDISLNYQRQGEEVMRRLKSSLDDIVKRAVRSALKQELSKQTEKVRAKLMAQANEALAPVDDALQQFGGLETLLADKEKLLEGLLK